jgi:hypothetical protein
MAETASTAQSAAIQTLSADAIRSRMAEAEAQKMAEKLRQKQEQEEKQKAVVEELHKPFARTPEQLMQTVMQLIDHAAESGQSEVQVYRFPNALCSDRGRKINNSEPGWEATLEGRPKVAYDFWHEHLRPLGFHLKAEVLDYPGGMTGDIGFVLSWKQG